MPEMVTLGETCVVMVAKTGGPLRYSAEFERRPGGAESTVAAGVAKLGRSAGWISRLGDDEFGHYVLGVMRAEGVVEVSNVQLVTDAPTGNLLPGESAAWWILGVLLPQGSAFSSLAPEDLDAEYVASARLLHLTGITPGLSSSCLAAVERAVDIARAAGVAIVFDPNYRAKVWDPEKALPCLESIMAPRRSCAGGTRRHLEANWLDGGCRYPCPTFTAWACRKWF